MGGQEPRAKKHVTGIVPDRACEFFPVRDEKRFGFAQEIVKSRVGDGSGETAGGSHDRAADGVIRKIKKRR